MSAKTTELKPCPFCGSGNVRYKEAEHAVVCARCKARGSIAPDEEMAIRMWDERAGELKPDSWEKLEEDLGKIANNQTEVVCPYYDREIKDCEGCKLEGYDCSCSHAFLKDVMARIRKLRGED